MGERNPFDLDEAPVSAEPLPVAVLQEMAALLRLVQHYREEAERLAHDYEWLASANTRRYEAKKAK